jgi:FdhD protein
MSFCVRCSVSESRSAPAEASVWIGINGVRRRVLACSPHQLDALAIGHLAGDGCIHSMRDVIAIETVAGPGGALGVNVVIDDALARAAESLHRHRLEFGCGLRHELDCAPDSLRAHGRVAVPIANVDVSDAFRTLFGAADRASPSGGLHACALVRGANIAFVNTDVARHCAVDRVLGLALQAGADLRELGLLLSARLSAAMALKAAIAGVGWIASRSVATSLAAEIVAATQLPLLQRAVRRTSAP